MAKRDEDPAGAISLLKGIQDLLRDSSYSTTYKFALLHALCDLSRDLAPTEHSLSLRRVAERVVELYWAHDRPFNTSDPLKQGTGKNARALTLIHEWNALNQHSLRHARISGRLAGYGDKMLALMRRDVLRRLQAEGKCFLYQWPTNGDTLELLPDVPHTLRTFHCLLTDMIQMRWAAFVEQVNPGVAGSDALRDHLFGADRTVLRCVVDPMLELQGEKCFYSGTALNRETAVVDHFLPWTLARNNSVGNLVLCTAKENSKKSDTLYGNHRQNWEDRNTHFALNLSEIAQAHGLEWDPKGLANLAVWAFSQAS